MKNYVKSTFHSGSFHSAKLDLDYELYLSQFYDSLNKQNTF